MFLNLGLVPEVLRGMASKQGLTLSQARHRLGTLFPSQAALGTNKMALLKVILHLDHTFIS